MWGIFAVLVVEEGEVTGPYQSMLWYGELKQAFQPTELYPQDQSKKWNRINFIVHNYEVYKNERKIFHTSTQSSGKEKLHLILIHVYFFSLSAPVRGSYVCGIIVPRVIHVAPMPRGHKILSTYADLRSLGIPILRHHLPQWADGLQTALSHSLF